MRVRLSERQLKLIKEENKKISSYEKIKSHRIFPHLLDFIKDKENEESDYMYSTHHYSEIIAEMVENYGIPYTLGAFTLLYYLIQDNFDPQEIMSLSDYTYKSNDVMGLLKASGYYDEYVLNRDSFRDIKKTEDGRILFSVDHWVDFAPLFREESIAEGILSEDWFEMYDYYDYPMTDITESLSDENIKYIIDYIIENYNGQSIGDLSHRNEFEEIINEDGELIVDERLKTIILDGYNLGILIDESDLSNEDIANSLTSAYNSAYNSAAEGELWEEAKNEIEDFLGSKGKWGKDDMLVFDITDTYQNIIDDYVLESHEVPEEFSFISLLYDYVRNYYHAGQLKISDLQYFYPSSDAIERDFNDNIRGYF